MICLWTMGGSFGFSVLCLFQLLGVVLKPVLSLMVVFVSYARLLYVLLGLTVFPWPILALFLLCLTDHWGLILLIMLSGTGFV